jgi:hypothetical protein
VNVARLLFIADFLERIKPEDFNMKTWVTLPAEYAEIGFTLNSLPAESKACPVGLLPAHAPDDWCWQLVDNEAYPVFKGSALWTAAPGLVLRGSTKDHVSWYVWRQLAEWLDATNLWLLQFMFSPVYYAQLLQQHPCVVAARVLKVAHRLREDGAWESVCPDHPSDILSYLVTQGFGDTPV